MNIGAAGFILSIIREGYKIPFIVFTLPKVNPNSGSALKESKINLMVHFFYVCFL